MKKKIRKDLMQFQETLERELNKLIGLRNKLMKAKRFDLAVDLFTVENRVKSLQQKGCEILDKLYDKNSKVSRTAFLHDNVD